MGDGPQASEAEQPAPHQQGQGQPPLPRRWQRRRHQNHSRVASMYWAWNSSGVLVR
jgi:hypothetical protein